MSSISSRLGIEMIPTSAGDAVAIHNQSIARLDGLVQASVKSRVLSAAPASPATGDTYLIKPTATGSWTGRDNHLAYWNGTTWLFTAPKVGMIVWVENERVVASCHTGPSWKTRPGDAFYAGHRGASLSIPGTSFVDVDWTTDLVSISNSAVFDHSTSVDPFLITLKEAGEYLVNANLTVEATGTAAWTQMNAILATSPVGFPASITNIPHTESNGTVRPSDIPRATIDISAVVSVGADTCIRAMIARQSATASTINLLANSRIAVQRI
jgi:hypothetical protein